MVTYGAPAFAKRHTEILATFYKGATKHHYIRRIRFVMPEVAIVDIDNEVRGVKAMPGGIIVPPDGIVKTGQVMNQSGEGRRTAPTVTTCTMTLLEPSTCSFRASKRNTFG
jgi:hypothetical protein